MTPLPCPFCGHTGVQVIDSAADNTVQAECGNHRCKAGGPVFRPMKGVKIDRQKTAINEWNRRA